MKRGQKEFVEKIAKLDNDKLYQKLKRNVMIDFTRDDDEPQDWFDRQLIEEFEQRLRNIGFLTGFKMKKIVEEGPPAAYPDDEKPKPKPSSPAGYKKFGKAITKLSPKELEDLMKPKNEN